MKKILSIDGGGIKGVFPAAVLAEIEEQLDRPLVDYFDLIAGTSTGGIIALGLGLGFSAREILSMYQDNAEKIFPEIKTKKVFGKTRELYRISVEAMYSADPLKQLLRDRFQGKLLGQSKTRLMICSTNLQNGRVNVFKTAHHERLHTDYKIPAVDIALATSAAPILFNPHEMPNRVNCVDGALWGNNPMGFAAVEAVNYLEWPRDEVAILSLSCTSEPPDYGNLAGRDRIGGRDWGMGLIRLAMDSQSDASMGMAIHVLGDMKVERIKRINPIVPQDMFSLTGTKRLDELKALGRDCAKREFMNIKELFFADPAPEFIPEHKLG